MLWLFTVKSVKGHAHLASCVQSHLLPAFAARFHNKADKNSPEGEADPHDAHWDEDETSCTSMPFKREAQRSERQNDHVCRYVDMGLVTGLRIWC